MGSSVTRLVVRAPNPLGDAVMALPAIAELRQACPELNLVIAAAPSVAPLFSERTIAAPDLVVAVDKRTEAAGLRELRADAALLLTNSFRTAWACRRAGIELRWGYGAHGRSLLLTTAVPRPRARVHQSEYYRQLVRVVLQRQFLPSVTGALGTAALGTGTGSSRDAGEGASAPVGTVTSADGANGPSVQIAADTRRRTRNLLASLGVDDGAPLVGLAPGAAYGHAKRWPPDRVAALVTRLAEHGVTCMLVGAADDRDAGREIESALPRHARVLNVIGRTDLRLLAGLLASCHVFVSNDSGAMHLAAAVGVPVTAIFGPTDERVTAPLGNHDVILHQVFCRPCMLRDCPIDHRCMKRIGVDRVYESVIRRLHVHRPTVEGPA